MENINSMEVERRIGYLKHSLGKIEKHMLKEQSERIDIKQKLTHLYFLQNQIDCSLRLIEEKMSEDKTEEKNEEKKEVKKD